MKKSGWFDAEAFYGALDATRKSREFNWKQVSEKTGVSASTLTRMAQGKRPDVDGLAALTSWAGLSSDSFVRSDGDRIDTEPLVQISSYLRSDKNLSANAASALEEIIRVSYSRLKGEER